jgi:RHS repeat-associated protein
LDEIGALIKDYIWTEGMHPVAQIDNTLGVEAVLYLYTDHLMTNRLATDELQSVAWRWEGEAFGNTPAEELAGFSINLRYPGQYFDQETNLHYNWNRYYDPQVGRYITSDPIGIVAGTNTYNYVGSNSISSYDFQGLSAAQSAKTGSQIGGAVGSIAGPGGAAAGRVLGGIIGFGAGLLLPDPNEDCKCEELRKEINQLVTELRVRYLQATVDKYDLYSNRRTGIGSWMGHKQQYENKQKALRKKLEHPFRR